MALSPNDNNAKRAADEPRERQSGDDTNRDQTPTDSGAEWDDGYSDSDLSDIVLRPLEPGKSLVNHSGPEDDDVAIPRGRMTRSVAVGVPPTPATPEAPIELVAAEPADPRRHVNYPVVAGGARRDDHVPHPFPGGPPAGPPGAPDAA
ncbi:hypothetical protein FRC08_004477 [Ceratobasidium sp. 394]|nr:hypothetical protein FRC08_004477 [Ceratobasidium sp. 394]